MPGYITGFAEQALVDSKNPKAKPLPIAKMMVHHFLYFAAGRVDEAPGGCWSGAGFIGGRGEEHPTGGPLLGTNAAFRAKYGINNRNRRRQGPGVEPHRHGDEPLQEAEGASTSARGSTTRPRSARRCSRS